MPAAVTVASLDSYKRAVDENIAINYMHRRVRPCTVPPFPTGHDYPDRCDAHILLYTRARTHICIFIKLRVYGETVECFSTSRRRSIIARTRFPGHIRAMPFLGRSRSTKLHVYTLENPNMSVRTTCSQLIVTRFV